MGELCIFFRKVSGEQVPVEVPMMASVGDLHSAGVEAGACESGSRLMYMGKQINLDPEALLADLGIGPQCVVDVSADTFSDYRFDPDKSVNSYTHPEKWKVEEGDPKTVERSNGGGYTCNIKMKPAKTEGCVTLVVQIVTVGQGDEYDSIGFICEAGGGDVFCSRPQNTRLRPYTGEVFIDGAKQEEKLPIVQEGSIVKITFDSFSGVVTYQVAHGQLPGAGDKVVEGKWEFWKKETGEQTESEAATFVPAVQTRHEKWKFTILS